MAEYSRDVDSSFLNNFCCKICFEVLHDPVQCQNNEHHFCRKCITKHLENSETCPMCMDHLIVETLRPPSRIILEIISQLKKPVCSHVSRGCTENVKADELLLHEQTCGYAPVVCSNEGCLQAVNRRDKESHETKECKFRKITCEDCNEEMMYVDYEKHQCTLRKEMNEMKARLDEVTQSLKQVVHGQSEILKKLTVYDQAIKDLQNPLRRASSATFERTTAVVNGQIYIFGGYGESSEAKKSLEIFNWSTKTWTLVKDCLFFNRLYSYSFIYENKILICGGIGSKRIEFFNPCENGFASSMFPGNFTRSGAANAVKFRNRLISFGEKIEEIQLEAPWETRTLLEKNYTGTDLCGVECFGSNVFVVGNSKVARYDTVSNELTLLPSLPYKVIDMATVAYKDNIIILGGRDSSSSSWQPLNDVLMYNIHSLECKRLPFMLERRSACSAVIMGDVIVVMGGTANHPINGVCTHLDTVEYYVMGEDSWRQLPAMNLARYGASACVHV